MTTPSSPHRRRQGKRHDRFRARKGVWVIAAALAVMLLGASVESSTHNVEASTESVEVEVAWYAQDFSVSEAEAKRRLDRLDGIYDVIGPIRDIEAERLAGWGIDHAGTLTGWVWLTGSKAPSAEAASLADAHADVEIRLDAAHSRQDLLKAQERFGDGSDIGPVARVSEGPQAVADYSEIVTFTAVNMSANTLQIGIDPALAPKAVRNGWLGGLLDDDTPSMSTGGATDAELRAAITELESDFQGSISVAYEVVDGRNIVEHAMFDGGRPMAVGSSNRCTSGFAARLNGTSDYGLITAGHCSGNLQMNGVTLPWTRGYQSTTADAEFRKVPRGNSGENHELRSQFVYGNRSLLTTRVVRGTAQREDMEGLLLCHQGMNSGVSCGIVTAIDYSPTHSRACLAAHNRKPTACSSVFVRVDGPRLRACQGDSGGPWFSASKAYGIHKAGSRSDSCTQTGVFAIFSAIDEVEKFLDATILISNNITFINN